MSSKDSVAFLRLYEPEGPWDIVAFPIEGGPPRAQRFRPDQADDAVTWIATAAEKGHNLYFHVNPNNAPNAKAKKGDVSEVRYLHVDLDPHEGEDWEDAQDRITGALLDEMPSGVHPPTFVVDSGNGYWGFWKLEEPIKLDGSEEAAEQAERYNRALEEAFEGDNCHNVDRVARLPGISNCPNAKKRALGRIVRPTSMLLHEPDNVWPTAVFRKAQPKNRVDLSSAPIQVAEADVEVFVGADTKPLLDRGLMPRTVATILHGWDTIEHGDIRPSDLDRSQVVFHVACEMERREIPDNVKAGIFLNEAWAINEHNFAQKGNTLTYVLRQIARGKEAVAIERATREEKHEQAMDGLDGLIAGQLPPDDYELLLAWGNQRHAVLGFYGGKTVVMDLEAKDDMRYLTPASFKDLYNHQAVHVPAPTAQDPLRMKVVPFGQWWMSHPERNTYYGLTFDAGPNPDSSLYNQYRGFALEPNPETGCTLYMEHLLVNLCREDELSFEYLTKWMARAVQDPESPGGAAIVLKGSRGTGKSTFAHWFGSLFHPTHYFTTSDGKLLVGDFNAHLDDKVVVFADEAIFAGDRKSEGNLKTLITETKRSSVGKGLAARQVDNHVHLIMASNSDWVVPAGAHERRYLVLDVSDDRRQDNAYFEAIRTEMENGGRAALLALLLGIDLEGFDVYNAPKTIALRLQSDESLSSEDQWWLEKLLEGQLLAQASKDGRAWPDEVSFCALNDDYLDFVRDHRNNHPLGPQALGARLRRYGFPNRKSTRRNGKQVSMYASLPSLDEMRQVWDETHGGNREWPAIVSGGDEDESVF